MADATKHTECQIKRNGQQRATAVSGGIYVRIELYAVSSQPKGTPRTGFTRVLGRSYTRSRGIGPFSRWLNKPWVV